MNSYSSLSWQGVEPFADRIRGLGRIGIKVHADDAGIGLELPDGWTIEDEPPAKRKHGYGARPPWGRSIHRIVLDDQGRRRAFVMEARDKDGGRMLLDAFAHTYYSHMWGQQMDWVARDHTGKVLYSVGLHDAGGGPHRTQRIVAEVERWLDANYPDWRDPAAYWD